MNIAYKNFMFYGFSTKKAAYIIEIIASFLVISSFFYFYLKGMQIQSNTYYYTLSTISQTLAAMVAFTGMFLVYRLQILENNCKSQIDTKKLMGKVLIPSIFAIVLSVFFLASGEFFYPNLKGDIIWIFGFIVWVSIYSFMRILEVYGELIWFK